MPPRPLTAAIFASSFYPHVGGVEELVRQLAAYQRTTNRQAAVATNRFPASLPAFEVREDTPIHRYAFVAPRRHPLRWLEAMRSRGPLARRIAEDMRAYAPDVIHVQCVSVNAWYAEQVARQLGVPLVVTLQGELTMDAHNIYAQSRFLRTSLRRLLHEADAVTACSEYVLREAEAFGDVSLGARGFVVHNGVSVADFDVPARQSDRRYVLAIG
ncbi:MAG: glycogen synthase, partial [Actinomycetota bacterium]